MLLGEGLECAETKAHTDPNPAAAAAAVSTAAAAVWEPGTPHQIEVSITVSSVGNVNTSAETIDAALLIDVYWLPSEAELAAADVAAADVAPEWDCASNFRKVTASRCTLRTPNPARRVHGL